jgi:acetamidase/formamidase
MLLLWCRIVCIVSGALNNAALIVVVAVLCCRIVCIVSGALNNAAAKKLDLEAWFPGTSIPYVHCKKRIAVSHPQPGCHLPNSPWLGMIKLFPPRESLVSDIPAGDRKITTLFVTLYHLCNIC